MKLQFASKTIPDWDSLARVIEAKTLDKGVRNTRAYLQVLVDLHQESWRHMFYTFYFELPVQLMLSIATRTTLKITYCPDFDNDDVSDQGTGFISGNLEDWQTALTRFCNKQSPIGLRAFFNTIMTYLETDGIRFPHSKLELNDRTFTLTT